MTSNQAFPNKEELLQECPKNSTNNEENAILIKDRELRDKKAKQKSNI